MNKITKEVNQEIREERGREVENNHKENEMTNKELGRIKLKNRVLVMLKEDFDYKNEKAFNKHMKEDYNAYDDEDEILKIFEVVSDTVFYEYNSSPAFNSYGQVSYYSNTIRKNVLLTQNDDFWYQNLDEIIEAILGYEVETKQVEYNMKHNKGGE